MGFKATMTGLLNSTFGFIFRLIFALIAACIMWFLIGFVVDVLLNFLAHGTYEGTQEHTFNSQSPLVMGINGFICLVVFIFIAKPRKG